MKAPIPIPRRLKACPLYRGLPIPFVTFIREDGQPDFRVTDEHKRRDVILNHWCQLCGQALGKWFFFAGGIEAAKSNAYFEPACHLDCLIYAMRVCPFIVGRVDHADTEKIAAANPDVTIKTDDNFASVRNPWWIIKKATSWDYVRTKAGTILLRPHAITVTEPLFPETMTTSDWERIANQLKG